MDFELSVTPHDACERIPLDYAAVAEISGWSPVIAPEAINCAAPRHGQHGDPAARRPTARTERVRLTGHSHEVPCRIARPFCFSPPGQWDWPSPNGQSHWWWVIREARNTGTGFDRAGRHRLDRMAKECQDSGHGI